MSKSALREWVTSHATDDADAVVASKLIAAYVATAVRADRERREEELLKNLRVKLRVEEMFRRMGMNPFGPLGL